MTSNDISVARELMASAKWNVVATVLRYASTLASVVVTGRYLAPHDFGEAALVTSSSAFFMLLSQFGLAQAVIGQKSLTETLKNTVFSASLILATTLYLALFVSSPFLAHFYATDKLSLLLRVNGLGLFLSLGTAIPMALVQRTLDYRGQALIVASGAIAQGGLSIIMAIMGTGIWALVVPQLAGSIVSGVISVKIARYRPAFELDLAALRQAMNFGTSSLISNFCNFACNNVVSLGMGKVWSNAMLGQYNFCDGRYGKPFEIIASQLSNSLFPILAKVAHKYDRVQNAFLRLARIGFVGIAPIYVLMIITTPVAVPLVFGRQWLPAVPIFETLCFLGFFRALAFPVNSTLYAMNRPEVSARVVIFRVIGFAALIGAACLEHWGPVAVAIGLVVVDSLVSGLYVVVALRVIRCPLMTYIRSLWAPLLACVALHIVARFAWAWAVGDHASMSQLIVYSFGFGLAYLLYIYVMLRDEVKIFHKHRGARRAENDDQSGEGKSPGDRRACST